MNKEIEDQKLSALEETQKDQLRLEFKEFLERMHPDTLKMWRQTRLQEAELLIMKARENIEEVNESYSVLGQTRPKFMHRFMMALIDISGIGRRFKLWTLARDFKWKEPNE